MRRMQIKDIEDIVKNDKDFYSIKVNRYRKRIVGQVLEQTIVTGYSLWAGCDAIKVRPWHKRHGAWSVTGHYKIIPIMEIVELAFKEEF